MTKPPINRMFKGANPQWKGDEVSSNSLHQWLKSNHPKPVLCEECKKVPPKDLANVSPTYNPETYTRDISNWQWLCRRCHMIKDGRISLIHARAAKRPVVRDVKTGRYIKNV